MADIPIVDPRDKSAVVPDPAAAARRETMPGPHANGTTLPIEQVSPIGNCDARTPHPYTAHELAWRPDPKSHSQSAEQWRQDSAKLRTQPLDMDGNGYHKVVSGDDLSTIAMRSLRDQGKGTGHEAIQAEMSRIVSLNVQAYPGLEKNPDLLRNGDSLRISDCNGHPDVQLQPPAADTAPGGRYGRYGDAPVAPPVQPQVDQGPPGGRYGRYGDVPGVVAPGVVPQGYAPVRQEVPVVRPPVQVQTQLRPAPYQYQPGQYQPGQYQPGYYHRVNPAAAMIGTVASIMTGGIIPGIGIGPQMWGDRHHRGFPMIGAPSIYPPGYQGYQGYPQPVGYNGYPTQAAALGYTDDTTVYDYSSQPQVVYVGGTPQQYYPQRRRHR